MRLVVVIVMLSSIPCVIARAQLPGGYEAEAPQPLPDSLREIRGGGRFTITVTRAQDSLSHVLIERAESLVPPTDSVIASTRRSAGSGDIAAFESAARLPGRRWWWREFDNVLLPYALTGRAVAHYIDRVRELSSGANPFDRRSPASHRASVGYDARVEQAVYGDGYQVTLTVTFDFYCGSLCALHFEHSRVVDFDRAGNPIRVRGDGPPVYIVS